MSAVSEPFSRPVSSTPHMHSTDAQKPSSGDHESSTQRHNGTVNAELKFVANGAIAPAVHIESRDSPSRYSGEFAMTAVQIRDGRPLADILSLDTHGFALRKMSTPPIDFENDEQVTALYFPKIEALVKEATGASRVLIFDHTVRKDGNNNGRTPARHVHVDYTEASAPNRVRDFVGDSKAADLLAKRYSQVNVWRSIRGAVERSPLALLDAQTLDRNDLIRTELHNQGRVGEIYSLRHAPRQQWYYFPKMEEDEAILIKGFDSESNGKARFTPHTAFDDPKTAPEAAPRESIEVRTFAFFD